jgi:hypothetical protein
MKKPTLIAILLIILAGLIGAKALLHPGFYTSHDGEHQLVRLYVFDQALRDGHIPVRYNRQLYNGYGYPLFMFTYRLPFYIGEIFRLTGFSYVDAIKATFLFTYLASGLTMFWFSKRWGLLAGLVAAILYMWAPYRFSVMFVRAALGEHVALVFIPLLFLSIRGSLSSRSKVLLGGISIAGLLLSHAMIAQILIIPITLWFLLSWWQTRNRQMFMKRIFVTLVLGIGLSAFYVVPAAVYRKLTQTLNPFFFADHFVTLKQLIYSPWGYGFSMAKVDQDGMSFRVGEGQWLAVGMMTVVVVYQVVKKKKKHLVVEPVTFLLIFALSLFLMTEYSVFIWNWWRNTINIDIPWRFLAVTTFSSATLGGWLVSTLRKSYLTMGVSSLLLLLTLYGNRNHLRVNKYVDYPDEKLFSYTGTSNTNNEYRPRWDDLDVVKQQLPEVLISQGEGVIELVRSKSNSVEVAVKSADFIRIDINTLFFPGWEVKIDGQRTSFKYAGEGGIMRVDVPAGGHLIQATYRETLLSKVADVISVGSVALVGMICYPRRRKRK